MKYLLDTDHLSIIQRKTGGDYANLSNRINQYPHSDFAVSIVTFHEQLLGAHTYISRARHPDQVVTGYAIMSRLARDFATLPLIAFDRAAMITFQGLQAQNIQLKTMDLRIASIAVSRGLILLTRNTQDFKKVPNLSIEDWTI
ncbi:type II toxin-antitoxin system VapC family toxin [Dactylococcopsis salina]|uniref:Nucleic acid-binding protein, contains PIN domain n=1 Tax=Dactylococcopsis salina (strain PCC 8305) TaxID=13035 RepID=K9YZ04_DACS8|nr:type II toxin-antitoxin system VapC family toxin [Dactylococcopsis salina]AFZ51697.1 putative nucleic acid-binding protein, contains PIN domain [Dactylococcopsis salina PCC 8305]